LTAEDYRLVENDSSDADSSWDIEDATSGWKGSNSGGPSSCIDGRSVADYAKVSRIYDITIFGKLSAQDATG